MGEELQEKGLWGAGAPPLAIPDQGLTPEPLCTSGPGKPLPPKTP